MKKVHLLVSALLLAAVLLSACAGGGNQTNNGALTPGVVPTEAGQGLATATTAGGAATATTAATAATEATATTAAGGGAATATVGATVAPTGTQAAGAVTGTPEAGLTATPGAGMPVTGDTSCRVYSIKNLLDYTVVDSTGAEVGAVVGVVLLRDPALVTPAGATPVPDATQPAFNKNVQPQIAYVVVDTAGGAATGAGAGAATATPAAGQATATAAPGGEATATVEATAAMPTATVAPGVQTTATVTAGGNAGGSNTTGNNAGAGSDVDPNSVLVPFRAFVPLTAKTTPVSATAGCVLTLKGQPELSSAPRVDFNSFAAEDWDAQLSEFWLGQGISISRTSGSGAALGAPVLLRDSFTAINAVNPNGDDLGEVDDFIFEPQFGAVRYAVLQAGGFLGIGEKNLLVPMSFVMWTNADDAAASPAGQIVINISADDWKNAPDVSMDLLDTTASGWDRPFLSYWNALRAPGQTTPVP